MAENDQTKHTSFYSAGWWTVIIGIIAFSTFLIDYNSGFLLDYNGVSGLSAIISSTSGICFSLAGLFFVIDNLKLQREALKHQESALLLQQTELANQVKEMNESNKYFKQQNEALISQQYQTTFFNLLEAHTTLINSQEFSGQFGFDGLSKLYKNLQADVATMKAVFEESGLFHKVNKTGSNPINILLANSHTITSIFEDLITIIKVINEKLEGNILYFDILNNYLSVYEKYLIGIYCDCIKDKYSEYFIGQGFNFLKFYQSHPSQYKLTNETYFPFIEIFIWNRRSNYEIILLAETKGAFDFCIQPKLNYLQRPIKLEHVKVRLSDGRINNSIKETFLEREELKINHTENGSIVYLNKALKNFFQEITPEVFYYLEIDFRFSYIASLYTVRYDLTVKKDKGKLDLIQIQHAD